MKMIARVKIVSCGWVIGNVNVVCFFLCVCVGLCTVYNMCDISGPLGELQNECMLRNEPLRLARLKLMLKQNAASVSLLEQSMLGHP